MIKEKNEIEIKLLAGIAKNKDSLQLKNFLKKTDFYYWHSIPLPLDMGKASIEEPQFIQIDVFYFI